MKPLIVIPVVASITLCSSVHLLAQTPTPPAAPATLQIISETPVATSISYPLVEPHLSVDARNGKHLVGAAMGSRTPDNQDITCLALASFDSGRTWMTSDFGLSGPTACGDVWTVIADDGAALLSYGSDSGLVVHRSADGGRSWRGTPQIIRGNFDHPMFLQGTATAGAPREIYIISEHSTQTPRGPRSAVYVARSTDNGRVFVDRSRVVMTNLEQEAIQPIALARGVLAFGTIDHHDASNRRVGLRRTWFAISSDSGATFSEPMFISELCSSTRFMAWPSLAVAPAAIGAVPRIYFTCEAQDNHGILFASSDDRGNRWTAMRRIDGGPDSTWSKTPTMAVSPAGVLTVMWVDARDDSTNICAYLYGIASRDGGKSFTVPQRLSTRPSCPTAKDSGEGVVGRFPSGGEYHGLIATGSNEFMALWPQALNGRFELRAVRFAVRMPS